MKFNKKLFAELLDSAKGITRSINEYAFDVDVSAAHISRFMRCLIDSPPHPSTILKLASSTHNGITYEDFMFACGFIRKPMECDRDIADRLILELSKDINKVTYIMKEKPSALLAGECKGLLRAVELIHKIGG